MCSKKYNNKLHRFLFSRGFGDYFNTTPDLPIGFLFNVSVRYLNYDSFITISVDFEKEIPDFLELVKRYCALYNIQSYNQWEDIFIHHEDLPKKIQEFALYDSVFNIIQFNPLHLRKLLKGLFFHIDTEKIGYNLFQYIDIICDILEANTGVLKPIIINKNKMYKKYDSFFTARIDTILEYFSHKQKDINGNYRSIFDKYNIDEKPLIKLDSNNFLLLNSSMSAMAVYEAIMIDLRNKFSNFDGDIGYKLEEAVKKFFKDKNINVITGKYKNGKGDCDLVIESDKTIVLIEVKKKALTKEAKSGNDVDFFIDFSRSLIDSLIQLNKHEIILKHDGKLELEEYNIEFSNRKIDKISLSMHDFGTIQDKAVLDVILRNMEIGGYDVYNPERKEEFNKVMLKSKKLREQIDTLKEINEVSSHNPHFNCYYLCLDQLLAIIDDSDSNESFVSNLQSIKHLAVNSHDFYQTYLCAKELKTPAAAAAASSAV